MLFVFQLGDLLQLLVDVDPVRGLPADSFLECETWEGEAVVVPQYCVRLVTDDYEIASLLSNRPRAQVQDAYTAASREELTVSVSTFTCSKPFASHCFRKRTMNAHVSFDLK